MTLNVIETPITSVEEEWPARPTGADRPGRGVDRGHHCP